jgi:leucyl-tRNA synthetase
MNIAIEVAVKDAILSCASVVFYELLKCRDEWGHAVGLHRDVLRRYIMVQCILLAPIAPHVCEHIFQHYVEPYEGKPPGINCIRNLWPVRSAEISLPCLQTHG